MIGQQEVSSTHQGLLHLRQEVHASSDGRRQSDCRPIRTPGSRLAPAGCSVALPRIQAVLTSRTAPGRGFRSTAVEEVTGHPNQWLRASIRPKRASVDSTAPNPHIGARESTNPRSPDPSPALGEPADQKPRSAMGVSSRARDRLRLTHRRASLSRAVGRDAGRCGPQAAAGDDEAGGPDRRRPGSRTGRGHRPPRPGSRRSSGARPENAAGRCGQPITKLTLRDVGLSPSWERLWQHVPALPKRRDDHRLTAPGPREERPRARVGTAEAATDQFRKSVAFLFEVVGGL
jgi:hypothetical protein